jgi:peptide/nickel transport system permease protein
MINTTRARAGVRGAFQYGKRNRLFLAACSLLGAFLLCALLAPWIAPDDPARLNLGERLLGPTLQHWFGTDELGRDVLSRTIYGARISLSVAVAVVGLSLVAGACLGMLAGFYGGAVDTVVNVYLSNAFLALPGILLAIALVAFLGPSLVNLIVALALAGWVN